ncbi:hypothetical protein [Halorubrum aquaticum]|uniref:hypothetical protein n=1 Tax=Halorubrum aquaticum TaxID=387340 RepID=UPI0031E4832D
MHGEKDDKEPEREDDGCAGDRGERPQRAGNVIELAEQELDGAEMDNSSDRRDEERSE